MDKEINLKETLAFIQAQEGEHFQADEVLIAKEYSQNEGEKSSIAIKILSVLGGFLATLAFLGFLMIAGLYDSEGGLLFFGVCFIAAALWLNKLSDRLITDTFSISVYVLGFALLALGLTRQELDETGISLLFMLIAAGALFITQNYILSFISVLIISGSLLVIILSNEVFGLVHGYIALITFALAFHMLNEAKMITSHKILSRLYDPVRIGLIISLLAGLFIVGKRGLIPLSGNLIWISSVVTISVVLYLISLVLEILGIDSRGGRIKVYTGSILILMPTLFAPAIAGAIIILLLSYLVNYKTGIAIGIMAVVYFISQYYYDLNLCLLIKSGILFFSGILFLLFYVFTQKRLSGYEKI